MALHGAALTAWKRKHPALVRRWGAKKRRKAKHTTHKRKRSKTMAKKRRKSSRRGGRRGGRRTRRSGGGGLFSLTKNELMYAGGAAAVYTYLSAAAAEDPSKYSWFTKSPVIGPIGRSATMALIAGVLYKSGVARKYTKPLALGVGAVALVRLAQRRFKMYDTDGSTAMAGELGEELSGELAGNIDLSGEFQ